MTVPLSCWPSRRSLLGIVPGPSARHSTIDHWLEPVFEHAEEMLGIHARGVPALRHRRLPDHRQRRRGAIGVVVGMAPFGFFRRGGEPERVAR